MADTPPPRSKTMGAGVGLIGAVGLVTVLMILFRGGGGTGTGGTGPGAGAGPGTGSGTVGPPTTAAFLASLPTSRPLKVTIQESDYVVAGRPLDLATVTDLAARIPAGTGPAVLIERPGSSRAKAEVDLREALDKKGIPHAQD